MESLSMCESMELGLLEFLERAENVMGPPGTGKMVRC